MAFEPPFYYIDRDHIVEQATHMGDDIATRALEIFRLHPTGEVHYTIVDGDIGVYLAESNAPVPYEIEGRITYQLFRDTHFLKIISDSRLSYFCQNQAALGVLIYYFENGPDDFPGGPFPDFFVDPAVFDANTTGGRGRLRPTPLSKRSKSTKRAKRTRRTRTRRTLRKK
jgi:hypothetical protein